MAVLSRQLKYFTELIHSEWGVRSVRSEESVDVLRAGSLESIYTYLRDGDHFSLRTCVLCDVTIEALFPNVWNRQ